MAATIRWFYQRISGPVTQAQNRFRRFIENIEQKTEPRAFLSQNLFKYLWSPWKSSKDKQILNDIIVLTRIFANITMINVEAGWHSPDHQCDGQLVKQLSIIVTCGISSGHLISIQSICFSGASRVNNDDDKIINVVTL